MAKRVIYCIVPSELAVELHDPLRRHYRHDSDLEVIVDRRAADRRSGGDRRRRSNPIRGRERRRIQASSGRRVAERRAVQVPTTEAPPLPRRFRRYADRIMFVERIEPSGQRAEDVDTARLVAQFQSGDAEAFSTIYSRYFDRVYSYLRVLLRDPHEAEDAAQHVFARTFEALPRYVRRDQPFRAWLFTIVRNHGIELLRRHGRLDLVDPHEADERWEAEDAGDEGAMVADWISDRELMLFVERLPLVQRQILLMRFMLDMPSTEIAAVLERTPGDVRKLQSRALKFLRARLAAAGRERPAQRRDRSLVRCTKQAPVLRLRRFALGPR